MKKEIVETIDFNGKKVTLKTGRLAPQADMSVMAQMGDTVVLATVVSRPNSEDPGFLPLQVVYEEKLYAAGIVKGSRWIKREGRPSDENVVAGRLIDHCVRYLFPKDLRDEIQLVTTVMSVDNENNPEIVAMLAASAVLTASDLPFNGPFASVQIGYKNDKFLLNPSHSVLDESDLNMIISYLPGDKVQAMEAGINLLPDEKIKEAIKYGNNEAKPLIDLVNNFAKKVGSKKRDYTSFKPSGDIQKLVDEKYKTEIHNLYDKKLSKIEANKAYSQIVEKALEELVDEDNNVSKDGVVNALDTIVKNYVRELAFKGERVDGRSLDEVRDISSDIAVLPKVHGSALFERGLTQVLSVVTLDSSANSLLSETLRGEEESFYFHHYVALGFSTGEPSRVGSPGRREIGHGMLAQKAIMPVLPSVDDFPYAIRVVSEILSQNGSSSMGATCGSSLALMDAGVPIKDMVGGISIGLVTNEEQSKFVVLTDIQGQEDFSGFMDFKMTGTKSGVTAIQMDIKLNGIPVKLFDEIIDKSKTARLKVLENMYSCISTPKPSVKESAPKIKRIKIDSEDIGTVIGSGGRTIKDIESKTGASVDMVDKEEYGLVVLSSVDQSKVDAAELYIENLLKKPEAGEYYDGVVTKILGFGALVEFLPGREGLVHISEIKDGFVEKVEDHLKLGQKVKVYLKEVTPEGKYVLTLRFKE